MNDKEFEAHLAEEGRHAEEAEADQTDRPLPAHVSVSQPNRTVNDELRAPMAAEAEAVFAAETDEDDGAPLPDHVTVTRPNRAPQQ
jgi:hypothetical protein